MRVALAAISVMMVAAVLFPIPARAQGTQNPPPPPPPAAGESSSKHPLDGMTPPPPPEPTPAPAAATKDAATKDSAAKDTDKNSVPLPSFNPLVAEKDVEVGTYYMKRGDVDAALDRFHEATLSYPTYALPWELMGEAYEKKDEWDDAIKSYQKYLKIYPHAPTRKKVEERISQLQKKLQEETKKTAVK
jgi:tetratricopeptide (TPR) repeat protein